MAIRKFKMSAAVMLQQSHVKRQHFIDNKPAFVSFDADFDDPFAADWLASIGVSEALDTDEMRDDVLTGETEDVLEAMNNARTKVGEVKYFAEKAFANPSAVLRELGFNDYDVASASQAEMATFLVRMHGLCNGKYNAQLLAVNFTPAKIAEILTIKNSLTTENSQQDTMLQNTAVATNERNDQLNLTFDFWHKVNKASKVVFRTDLARLNLFLFPVADEDPVVVKVQGTTRNQNNTLLQGVSATIEALGVSVISDSNGQYVIGGIPAGTYTIKFNKAGYQEYVANNIVVPAVGNVVVDAVLQPV